MDAGWRPTADPPADGACAETPRAIEVANVMVTTQQRIARRRSAPTRDSAGNRMFPPGYVPELGREPAGSTLIAGSIAAWINECKPGGRRRPRGQESQGSVGAVPALRSYGGLSWA